MANNRMFLVHRPSMARIHLGKRMARGWYRTGSLDDALADFFAKCEAASESPLEQDDFALVLEFNEAAPWAGSVVSYGGHSGVMEIAPPTGLKSDPRI